MPSLTFIGLGNMGAALAQVLARAGVTVTAWNRTQDRPGVAAAVAAGATYDPDVSSAVAKNDTIVVCLVNNDALNKVWASLPDGVLSGKTIINFCNGSPGEASDMDTVVRAKGAARYLDGAIMVPPYVVGTPGSMFILSGESEAVYNSIVPLIAPIGEGQYHGEDVSQASRFDNAMLVGMYSMFSGMFIGLGILKKGSKDGKIGSAAEPLVPLLQALVPLLGLIVKRWDEESWLENDGHPMDMMVAGLYNIKKTCEESGVDFGPIQYFLSLMEKATKVHGATSGLSSVGPLLLK
ncbi:hypothetical protein jhhlp_007486 [Lomentospora prolificans]|uniref:Uncharacterized protein n=1 Tax=Lomentospora prolificans TaxID=41688 RepID=A0A2N3N167_9PEZI|nr:hypothetical protein jhhlp_007486 [Lomentospora prolificans]